MFVDQCKHPTEMYSGLSGVALRSLNVQFLFGFTEEPTHKPAAVIPTSVPVAEPEQQENVYEEPPEHNGREQSPYKDEGTIFLDKGQCARALYDYQAG